MSASSAANIVIPEDSATEQEAVKTAARMTLKEVHNLNTLKENYHPRNPLSDKMPKDSVTLKGPTEPKRIRTVASKSTQTITEEEYDITAETPGAHYWMNLAEQRRQALEQTLDENLDLRIQLTTQNANLEQARIAIADLSSLVEALTELVESNKGTESNLVDDSGIAHTNESDSDDERC